MNIVLSFCTLGNNSLLWGEGDRIPPFHYNSMSWASSSEKSDMELSEEESPPPSSCSFRASSVAYFWMYSEKKKKTEKEEGRQTTITQDSESIKLWMKHKWEILNSYSSCSENHRCIQGLQKV